MHVGTLQALTCCTKAATHPRLYQAHDVCDPIRSCIQQSVEDAAGRMAHNWRLHMRSLHRGIAEAASSAAAHATSHELQQQVQAAGGRSRMLWQPERQASWRLRCTRTRHRSAAQLLILQRLDRLA